LHAGVTSGLSVFSCCRPLEGETGAKAKSGRGRQGSYGFGRIKTILCERYLSHGLVFTVKQHRTGFTVSGFSIDSAVGLVKIKMTANHLF